MTDLPFVDFNLTWHFSRAEFVRLQTLKTSKGFLLPQEGDIDQVYLDITAYRAVLHIWHYPIKKDGEKASRRKELTVLLTNPKWASALLQGASPRYRSAIDALWPE